MRTPLSILSLLALAAPAAAQTTVDEFETLYTAGAQYEYIGAMIDENTIAGAYGPGLVNDGCTYSDPAAIGLYFYGLWGGQFDGSIGVSTNGGPAELRLDYDSPVDFVELVLAVGNGWPDSADVTAYDGAGNVLTTQSGVSLTGPSAPMTVTFTQPGIESVSIVSSGVYNWGPYLNHHEYGSTGPALAATGTAGGQMTFDFSGFTPGGMVAVLYGPAGSFTAPGGPCPGLTVDLLPLNFPPISALIQLTADGNGDAQLSRSVPAAGAGLLVQGVDVGGCGVSNFVTIN